MSIQRRLFLAFFVSVCTALLFFVFVHADSRDERAGRGEKISGQYIVVFKDSVADVDVAENDIIAQSRGERLDSYRSALHGFSARLSDSELEAVKNDPRVEFVSEDRVVSIANRARSPQADSTRSRDGTPPPPSTEPSAQAVSSQSQTLPTGINRINAENKINKGQGVQVAIIDTGIYLSHSDLKANILGGKNCTKASGGYTDQNGHGTHVAGTIAALDNGVGVVGVAPSAKLWAVRVLDRNGSGTWSSVICGIDFVTSKAPANGGSITVANMSLGGGGVSDNNCGNTNNDALHKAICRARDAGVTIVVAAGNNGADASTFVPAAYDDAVITVSALADSDGALGGIGSATGYGADDTFASFSNWGAPVDIGAPGVNIYSTWLSNGYKAISGTSMASPHVAGAVALYIATHPITSPTSWSIVRDALVASGELLGLGHADPSGKHPEPVLQADTL